MFYATNEKIIHQMNQIWDEELMLGGVKKEIWIKSVSNEEKITLKLLYQKKRKHHCFGYVLQFNSFKMYVNIYNLNMYNINTS